MDRERMENNKVYLKIKEIEAREAKLSQAKKEIQECTGCGSIPQMSGRPEVDHLASIMEGFGLSNSRSQIDDPTQEPQIQNNAEVQTESYHQDVQTENQFVDEQDVENEPEIPQTVDEEYKDVSSEESEEEESSNPNIVYNSIRERYAKELERERRKEERRERRIQRQQNPPQTIPSQPPQNVQHTSESPQSPEEELRNVQGIVQLLSSKLLCQILSAGDLFQTHITDKFEAEIEIMRNKYFTMMYEAILKSRIFLADRHEHVERALQKIGFIPTEEEQERNEEEQQEFGIEEIDLGALEEKLKDKEVLKTLYRYIMEDEETYDM